MNTTRVISRLQEVFGLERAADLAVMLGCAPSNVSNWKRENHIPWKRREQIERCARERNVKLPHEFHVMVGRAA